MTRFQRLTDDEAQVLTRAELLDCVEAEQRYWARKGSMGALSPEDQAAEREFSRIMHTYLSLDDALRDAIDMVQGRGSGYWDSRPGLPAMTEHQKAGLAYGQRLLASLSGEPEAAQEDPEAGQ